jgi:hypothetical protein
MPLPNTREYASRIIKSSVKKCVISESDSVSSCPSSSSSDSGAEDDATAARAHTRRRRPLLRLKHSVKPDAASHKIPSRHFVIPHDSSNDKALVIIPNLLRPKKIAKMEALFRASPAAYRIDDRKSDLVCVGALRCA